MKLYLACQGHMIVADCGEVFDELQIAHDHNNSEHDGDAVFKVVTEEDAF